MPDGIQFHNIHHESTLSDLYADKVDHKDDNSCASDEDWKDRKNPEDDLKNLVSDVDVDDDEANDLVDDLNDKDTIHLNDGFSDIKDIVNDRVQHEEDNQQHHFGGPIENKGEQYNHSGGPDQENVMLDHNVNIDDDVVEDKDHNGMNIVYNESSRTSSDTNESSNTTGAHPDNTEDLSDEDDNDEAGVT